MSSRISILLPDLNGGGAERVHLLLAQEFESAGHKVEFVLMRARGDLLSEAESQFSVHSLNCERFRHIPLRLSRYLRTQRPDVLLAAMWPLTGVAALATLISGNKVKLVASEHIDFCATSSRKWIERLFLKRFGRYIYSPCRHIIAVSQGVAESLKIAAGLRPDRITVIHNPIGDYLPSEIGEDDRHMLSGWLDANDRLIAIGRLADQKRFDVLLRSFAEVRRQRNARLLILGEGPLREQLQELARNLGVAEVVWMPGFRQNPATFLQHAKVFVLSSDYEGLGNVIIEALAGGVPVVSTDCPSGPNEILENGKYGLLVPVGDHYEMSKAILRLLETQPNKKELMHRAEHFTPDAKAKSYLELLLGEKTF